MLNKTPIIETKTLIKTYTLGNDKIHALNGVSIKVRKGEYVAIIGKSGSGKSTLMHIMGLLDTPSSGKILLEGKDVSNTEDNELAKIRNEKIGFVFQSFNLLNRTSAIDNVILPLKYSTLPKSQWKHLAEKMLKIVGLEKRMSNRPNELSGGQRQRVAIARALVNDPAIILADEPTGNLDIKTGKEIIKLFKKLNNEGRTIVIVTHDEDIAKIADRKIIISDGKIL